MKPAVSPPIGSQRVGVHASNNSLGRSTGYVYSMNGSTRQTVTTGYGADGRINSAGFLHGGSEKQFAPLGRAGNGGPASQPTQPEATRPLRRGAERAAGMKWMWGNQRLP